MARRGMWAPTRLRSAFVVRGRASGIQRPRRTPIYKLGLGVPETLVEVVHSTRPRPWALREAKTGCKLRSSQSVAMFIVFCFVATTIAPGGVPRAAAVSLRSLFEQGYAALESESYDEALRCFRELGRSGVRDPDVYLNWALAEQGKGNSARALALFESALWLRPSDAQARRGFAMSKRLLAESLRDDQRSLLDRASLLHRIFARIEVTWLKGLALGLSAFGALLLALWPWWKPRRSALGGAAVVACALALLNGLGLAYRCEYWDPGLVRLVGEAAPLRQHPSSRSAITARLPAGTAATVEEHQGRFRRVKVSGVAEGWIERGRLQLVSIRTR